MNRTEGLAAATVIVLHTALMLAAMHADSGSEVAWIAAQVTATISALAALWWFGVALPSRRWSR